VVNLANSIIVLLAEKDAAPNLVGQMLFPMLAIGLLFYFMMYRPEKRKKAMHEEMLRNLKKNDRVQTVGGILGTVMSVNSDSREVIIRIDETNNTKMRITQASVTRIISEKDSKNDK